MEICKEMLKLREYLDNKGIEWKDRSTIDSCTIYRTHYDYKDYKFSVVYGFGTYGGYSPCFDIDKKLLEVMSECINGGEQVGYLTADDVIKYMEGI